jgi:hypothetical protein
LETILFGDSLHVGLFQPAPGFQKVGCGSFVVSLRSILDFRRNFLAILKYRKGVPERHLADDFGIGCPDGFVFGVQHIGQAQFGDGQDIGVERFSDELAAHFGACKINA